MKIIIIGKGCSGKDYLCSYLEKKGLVKSITYTTRPMRDNEIDGKDYYFISNNKFIEMINNNEFYEYDQFNNWYYGASLKDFNNCNLFIKTPRGINKLHKDDRNKCYIIYLNINDNILRERMFKRNDNNDNIERRINADKEQFNGFSDFDLEITDENYDINDIEAIVRYWLEDKFSLYES